MIERDRKLITFLIFVSLLVETFLLFSAYNNGFVITIVIILQIIVICICLDCNPFFESSQDDDLPLTRSVNISVKDIEDQDGSDECSICLDENKTNLGQLNCKHIFHKKCIKLWLKNNDDCPNCRENVVAYI